LGLSQPLGTHPWLDLPRNAQTLVSLRCNWLIISALHRLWHSSGFCGKRKIPSPSLNINGVEVSVASDALVIDNRRGRVGQAFIRCTIGTGGDAAENRRQEANVQLATIAQMHALQYLADLGQPHPQTSLVIDVSRETIFRAPANSARRIANIEAACAMIAAVWPAI